MDQNKNDKETANERRRRLHRERQQRYTERKRRESQNDNETVVETRRRLHRESQQRYRERKRRADEDRFRFENAAVMAEIRANESVEETQARRICNARRQAMRRANESVEEARARRDYNARRAARRRAKKQLSGRPDDRPAIAIQNQDDQRTGGGETERVYRGPICQFGGSINVKEEKPSGGKFDYSCCYQGRVKWRDRRPLPEFMKGLMSNPDDPNYRTFREIIRSYNSSISFPSMGAKIAEMEIPGVDCFEVHQRRTSHLHHPPEGETQRYKDQNSIMTKKKVNPDVPMKEESDVPKIVNTNSNPDTLNICPHCKWNFPIKSKLEKHIRLHTGEKIFECKVCSERFMFEVTLKKHIIQTHTVSPTLPGNAYLSVVEISSTHRNDNACDTSSSHLETCTIVNECGKIGCSLYELLFGILGEEVIVSLGVHHRQLNEILEDFLSVASTADSSAKDVNNANYKVEVQKSLKALFDIFVIKDSLLTSDSNDSLNDLILDMVFVMRCIC